MPTIQLPANGWRPRWYQKPAWDSWERGIKRQLLIWHRRAGKDELNLAQHAVGSHTRIGNYWHMLPEQAQARKVLWHAVNPITGKRRIYDAFPRELIEGDPLENEMMIRFKVGSTWQLMGSDNYDSAVGAPPVGITFSEWALANPTAWAYLSPILAENKGWASFISTPRGPNHLRKMYEAFKDDPAWFVELLGIDKTLMVDEETIASQFKEYQALFGDEIAQMLVEQEFYCSWAGASVGSILARLIDKAEQNGQISDEIKYDPHGAPVSIISDIGYYDTCAWWFVQPHQRGYRYLKYIGSSGLEAEEWILKLQEEMTELGWKLGKIWLPSDAKAKTFRAKRSSMELFLSAFGTEHVDTVPQSRESDQVAAARSVMPVGEFNETGCADGLNGLRAWHFEFNDETRSFSKAPKHDWASHPGQAFAYSAQVMKTTSPKPSEPQTRWTQVSEPGQPPHPNQIRLNDAWQTRTQSSRRI